MNYDYINNRIVPGYAEEIDELPGGRFQVKDKFGDSAVLHLDESTEEMGLYMDREKLIKLINAQENLKILHKCLENYKRWAGEDPYFQATEVDDLSDGTIKIRYRNLTLSYVGVVILRVEEKTGEIIIDVLDDSGLVKRTESWDRSFWDDSLLI